MATARREQVGPTVEQVKHVIALMPAESAIQRRDRALVAGCVEQDAREVQTKFSKTFTTYFFPVGEEIRQIMAEWVAFLREEVLWGNDDPLFPATRIALRDSRQFEAAGLERAHWSSAARIRTIFHDAFITAGLPTSTPCCTSTRFSVASFRAAAMVTSG